MQKTHKATSPAGNGARCHSKTNRHTTNTDTYTKHSHLFHSLLYGTIKELHSAHIMIEYEDRLGLCCTCRKYMQEIHLGLRCIAPCGLFTVQSMAS